MKIHPIFRISTESCQNFAVDVTPYHENVALDNHGFTDRDEVVRSNQHGIKNCRSSKTHCSIRDKEFSGV